MDMIWIHADENKDELGVLNGIISADMEVCSALNADLIDNTFTVTISEKAWAEDRILIGHFIYATGSEWGGEVTEVKHSTSERQVTVSGVLWRGMLFQKCIIPPPGEAYLTVTDMDAHDAIRVAIGTQFGDFVAVESSACGKTVTANWRYNTVADGLHRALRASGLRLVVRYSNVDKRIMLSAEPVIDKSDEIEVSQDYGIDFVSAIGKLETYNHCVALGSGELQERMVLHAYRRGNTVYTERPADWNDELDRTFVLDYPNAESYAELLSSAVQKLDEYRPVSSIDIDQVSVGLDVELGDIIGARDRLTGMAATAVIAHKILSVKNGRMAINVEVG